MKTTAEKPSIVIVGSGHLAWHLARYFVSIGLRPQIVNHRDSKNLRNFKNKLKCRIYPSLSEVPKQADYYFLCVSDRYVRSVSGKINSISTSTLLIHCSGTLSVNEIKTEEKHRAVFYPLQSFTAGDRMNWRDVPLLLETNHPHAKRKLKKLAGLFPGIKIVPDQNLRLLLHLCAVMVNNFSNVLYTEAYKLLEHNGHRSMFKHLFPLIHKAIEKLENLKPFEAQTGPAKRGDRAVLNKHRALIKNDRDLLKLYNLLSKRISLHQSEANA